MKKITTKQLLFLQVAVLFAGTVFAWSQLIPQITTFIGKYGTLLRFSDIQTPNPLTTACLYGSTAFLVVLYFSAQLFTTPNPIHAKRLRNFILFCVFFAASVVAYEAVEYYHLFGQNVTTFICTPGVNPVKTPCFTGMIFFIVGFCVSVFATRRLANALHEG